MPIFLILFFLFQGGSRPKPVPVIAPPAPAVTLSFERLNVRQQDCVNIDLLVGNESELELTNVIVEFSAPYFLTWHDGRCDKKPDPSLIFDIAAGPSMSLQSIAPRSTLKRQLHFRTGDTIEIGEYNVLFTVHYGFTANKEPAKSFVSAEKTIKVNFLGNESVAGIPLALAGFIVPGLLFWLMIKLFRASWSIDGLSDQMLYSVIVSLVLVVLGTWLKYWDLSAGVSIGRLTKLAASGAGLGLVVGFGDLVVRSIRKRRVLARQIVMGESESSLLGKLLELPRASMLERPAFSIKEGAQYAGALGAKTEVASGADKGKIIYSVVGSFSISLAEAEKKHLKTRLAELNEAGKMRELTKVAKENALLNPVVLLTKVEKEVVQDDEPFKQWYADEVLSYSTNAEGWDTPALDVK